jgi:hypothetical protein
VASKSKEGRYPKVSIFDLTVQMEDDYGRGHTKRFQTDEVDFATAQTAINGFLADLAGLTKLQIVTYTISEKSAYSDAIVSGANKDAGITLSVRKDDGEKAVLKVPDPVVGVVLGDGSVDLTNALVVDFVDNFITGNFKVSDGEDTTALLSGRLDE